MDQTNKVDATKESLEAENGRLQARVRELEAKLSAGGKEGSEKSRVRSTREETEDMVRDIPQRALDAFEDLARGLTHAFIEQLRSLVEAMNAVADETLGRPEGTSKHGSRSVKDTKGKDDRRFSERVADAHADFAHAAARGIHKLLDSTPGVVDRFHETYHKKD